MTGWLVPVLQNLNMGGSSVVVLPGGFVAGSLTVSPTLSGDLAVSLTLDGDLTITLTVSGSLQVADLLYLQNDNDIKISGLRDSDSGSYLNAETLTYAIVNEAGTTVTGATGTLTYQAASDGDYLGVVDASVMVLTGTVPFTLTGTFFVEVTVSGSGYDGFWRREVTVGYRG